MSEISTIANIEIQGEKVLRYISEDETGIKYRVLGFTDPEVFIIDHREAGIAAFRAAFDQGEIDEFPDRFCFPSKMEYREMTDQPIQIDLWTADQKDSKTNLWIAKGMDEFLPGLNYTICKVNWLNAKKDRYAVLTIYDRT